jgi:hypothetical protein
VIGAKGWHCNELRKGKGWNHEVVFVISRYILLLLFSLAVGSVVLVVAPVLVFCLFLLAEKLVCYCISECLSVSTYHVPRVRPLHLLSTNPLHPFRPVFTV